MLFICSRMLFSSWQQFISMEIVQSLLNSQIMGSYYKLKKVKKGSCSLLAPWYITLPLATHVWLTCVETGLELSLFSESSIYLYLSGICILTSVIVSLPGKSHRRILGMDLLHGSWMKTANLQIDVSTFTCILTRQQTLCTNLEACI